MMQVFLKGEFTEIEFRWKNKFRILQKKEKKMMRII